MMDTKLTTKPAKEGAKTMNQPVAARQSVYRVNDLERNSLYRCD